MALRVTTETGRVYEIEDGMWRRLPKPGERTMGWEPVWTMMHGTHFAHPWDSPDGTWLHGTPVIGEFMHLGSRSVWWTSTTVVSIVEYEEDK